MRLRHLHAQFTSGITGIQTLAAAAVKCADASLFIHIDSHLAAAWCTLDYMRALYLYFGSTAALVYRVLSIV